MPADVHADAVSLNYSRTAINVNDQAWQIVTLAMHEAEGCIIFATGYAHCHTYIKCTGQTSQPEACIDRFIGKRKHSHGYGTYLPMANSYEFAFSGYHTHEVAFGGLTVDMMHGSRENPRVEAS
jgi:hypothetical protein